MHLSTYTDNIAELQEAIRLIHNNDERKIIWFYGSGSNGKTTFINRYIANTIRLDHVPDIHKAHRYHSKRVFLIQDFVDELMPLINCNNYQFHKPLVIKTNAFPQQYVGNPDHLIIHFNKTF